MSNSMTAYSFGPSREWYEPADLLDDDQELALAPVELLVILHGWVWWTATTDDAELYAA